MTDPLLQKRKEVIALWKADTPVMKIVKATGLSWAAVKRTIKAYQTGGVEALTSMRGRPTGTGRIISPEHEDEIRNILYTKQPRDVRINQLGGEYYTAPTEDDFTEDLSKYREAILKGDSPQYLWCRDSVKELIHQISGIEFSSQLINKYLHRWGFPKTKQNQRPIERCSESIQDWLTNNPDTNTYWLYRQRLDPEEKQSKISATDNHRKEFWTVIQGNFSEEKQIVFLSQLMKQTGEPLTVIRYDYYHFTKEKVSRWLAKKNITLLPPLQDNERTRLENDQKRQLAVRDELQKETLAPLGITVKYVEASEPDES